MSKFSFLKKIDKNTALIGIAVIAIVITGVLIFTNSNSTFTLPSIFGQSNDQLAKKAVDYINNNKLSTTPASLVSVSEESGLVKIKIKIGTNEFDSYVSKDGKLLFAQAPIDMGTAEADNSDTTPKTAAEVQKTDNPMLEAYVVARCPYGLQMQRVIAEAVKDAPALANYIKVRYIGSVSSDGKTIEAMHGAAEATENLRQICIREEQPAKYWSYVSCQMKASGTETSCEQSTGVDSAKLSACISDTSRGVAYAKEDFALNTKYSVQGSPTLILDGTVIDESNFGGRSADAMRAIICAASNTEPSFCSAELNTAEAAVSFSETYAGSGTTDSSANCGS
jgi:hypothetical protein